MATGRNENGDTFMTGPRGGRRPNAVSSVIGDDLIRSRVRPVTAEVDVGSSPSPPSPRAHDDVLTAARCRRRRGPMTGLRTK